MSVNLTIIDSAVTAVIATTGAAAGRLAGALVAPATVALTAYILWMGFQIIYGRMETPIATLTLRALRISIILAFALGAGVYMGTVYGSIQGAETLLVSALAPGSSSIPEALGQSLAALHELVLALDSRRTPTETGGWVNTVLPDFSLLLVKGLLYVGQIIMVVAGFVPYVLAKVTLMLLAMLGPLFILCLIWPATQRFFESWVSAVVAALLTFAIIAALVSFITPVMERIIADPSNRTDHIWSMFILVAPCQLIFAYLMWTSGSIAGQLAGGGGSGNPLTGLVSTAMHHALGRVFKRGDKSGSGGGQMAGNNNGQTNTGSQSNGPRR